MKQVNKKNLFVLIKTIDDSKIILVELRNMLADTCLAAFISFFAVNKTFCLRPLFIQVAYAWQITTTVSNKRKIVFWPWNCTLRNAIKYLAVTS